MEPRPDGNRMFFERTNSCSVSTAFSRPNPLPLTPPNGEPRNAGLGDQAGALVEPGLQVGEHFVALGRVDHGPDVSGRVEAIADHQPFGGAGETLQELVMDRIMDEYPGG
jgi:hypothetical protein